MGIPIETVVDLLIKNAVFGLVDRVIVNSVATLERRGTITAVSDDDLRSKVRAYVETLVPQFADPKTGKTELKYKYGEVPQ